MHRGNHGPVNGCNPFDVLPGANCNNTDRDAQHVRDGSATWGTLQQAVT